MSVYDDNSLIWAVFIPSVGGIVGLLLLGPIGFFICFVIPLVIGANIDSPETEKDERIAELEQRVDELREENEK